MATSSLGIRASSVVVTQAHEDEAPTHEILSLSQTAFCGVLTLADQAKALCRWLVALLALMFSRSNYYSTLGPRFPNRQQASIVRQLAAQ
jgi:hypothetical protein